jgi:hypothetical protein
MRPALFHSHPSGFDYGDGSMLAPGLAKNTLCVGAAETEETPSTVAYFSSRGPTMDMRIKPDVIGPGKFQRALLLEIYVPIILYSSML